jgi:hypothetical protein
LPRRRYVIVVESEVSTELLRSSVASGIVATQDGHTSITLNVPDQTALHHALQRLYALGLVLVSVTRA